MVAVFSLLEKKKLFVTKNEVHTNDVKKTDILNIYNTTE